MQLVVVAVAVAVAVVIVAAVVVVLFLPFIYIHLHSSTFIYPSFLILALGVWEDIYNRVFLIISEGSRVGKNKLIPQQMA